MANVSKAIDVLYPYERIHCMLDNDKDFHHRAGLMDMQQGKYYVIKAVPSTHHTMGGVRINEILQHL